MPLPLVDATCTLLALFVAALRVKLTSKLAAPGVKAPNATAGEKTPSR